MTGSFVSPLIRSLIGSTPLPELRPVSLAVRRYLLERRTGPDRGGVLVAVSGGADSLALAAATLDLALGMGIPYLAVTVDHGMREESATEALQVKNLLTSLGAQGPQARATVVTRPQARDFTSAVGFGPEGDARLLRRDLLLNEASRFASHADLACVDVLFGHTLDDQAETVLLRLARGASATSLGAIHARERVAHDGERSVFFGRPLLGVRRGDTEGFCRALELPIVDDPSNRADGPWRTAAGDALPRAAIRERVLPRLNDALGVDVTPALGRLAKRMQEDDEALTSWAESLLASAEGEREGDEDSPPVTLEYMCDGLNQAPRAVRLRAYRMSALKIGVPAGTLASVHLEAIDDLVVNWRGQGQVSLPGKRRARRKGRTLVFALAEGRCEVESAATTFI